MRFLHSPTLWVNSGWLLALVGGFLWHPGAGLVVLGIYLVVFGVGLSNQQEETPR